MFSIHILHAFSLCLLRRVNIREFSLAAIKIVICLFCTETIYFKAALYDALLLQMRAFQMDYYIHVRKSHYCDGFKGYSEKLYIQSIYFRIERCQNRKYQLFQYFVYIVSYSKYQRFV